MQNPKRFCYAGLQSRCWLGALNQHYLRVGLAISLLLHAGLLAWRLNTSAVLPPVAQDLDITLVNAHTDTAPLNVQIVAQTAIDGGGNASQGVATTPLPRTGTSANTIVLQAMRQRQMQLEAEQARLLAQLHPAPLVAIEHKPVHPWDDAQASGDDTEDRTGIVQNAQIAALADRVHAYNAMPRKEFVAPAAQASRHAAYLDAWRTRIEAIGTQHYPAQARGKVYGSLRITVTIRSDGSLVDVEIDQPSPHAVLNQAARRIVQMAAPFAPFTPDMARDTDMLVITRSWHFVNDALETSAP